MKTFSTFFLSITILVACSPKIPIGKYLDKNSGNYIDIDKDQNYTFIQKGGVHNVSMYSKGMSTRDIKDHIQGIYGTDISPSTISNITDKIMDEASEWFSRPLNRV